MRKLTLTGIISLIMLWSSAQIPSSMPFLFQITDLEGEPLAAESLDLRLSVVAKFQSVLKYSEEHFIITDDAGVATVMLGEGLNITGSLDNINWNEGSHQISVEYRKTGEIYWKHLGKKVLLAVPFAHAAKNTGSRLWKKTEGTVHYLDGNISIGSTEAPYGLQLGNNHRMLLSNSRKKIPASSSVIFNSPTDTSKPAIVFFNQYGKSRAALVAHLYLHYPSRIHQHYSMEVSDNKGAQQTRFEFPWGVDTCVIQNHSSNFRVIGDFSVGDSLKAGRSLIGAHAYISNPGSLIISPSTSKISSQNNGLAHEGEPARLLINTPKADASAILRMQAGETTFLLQNRNGRLSIRDASSSIFLQHKYENGYMTIGSGIPNERLVVEGNIRISGEYKFLSGSSGMAEYFDTEEKIPSGSVAGINPKTGLARIYRPGDVLAGVATEESSFTGNFNPESHPMAAQRIVISGRVRVLPGSVINNNGKVYTSDGQYLGIATADGNVLLK